MSLALLGRYPDPSQPCLTCYLARGRVELSVRTLGNLVSKAANLLVDGLDVPAGAALSVDVQAHWQQSVWALAGWTAGLKVGAQLPGEVAVRVVGPAGLAARAATGWQAQELLVAPDDAFGLPLRDPVPAGVLDVGAELRGYADVWPGRATDAPPALLVASEAGLAELDWDSALAQADALAHSWGLPVGGRLLVTAEVTDALAGLLAATLVPLVRQAGIVVVASGSAASRRQILDSERITTTAGAPPAP